MKIHYFLFASTLVPQIAGSIYCDRRDVGVPCIVSLFAFSGPGRKAKFIIFPLPPPFAPKNFVEYLLYLSRGGEKLDGVSSTSLQGLGLGRTLTGPFTGSTLILHGQSRGVFPGLDLFAKWARQTT